MDTPEILDVGAGTGRFLKLFAQAGWKVTGAEPNPEYYKYLKNEFKTISQVRITQESFQDLHYTSQFDMILSINGPFSYLLTTEDRESAIEKAYKALTKDGILLIDTSNFSWILKNYQDPKSQFFNLDGKSVEHNIVHEFDFNNNILTHIDIFKIQGQVDVRSVHEFYMIGFPEIEYFLKKVQFRNISTYNSYEATEPCPIDHKRLLVVAQK